MQFVTYNQPLPDDTIYDHSLSDKLGRLVPKICMSCKKVLRRFTPGCNSADCVSAMDPMCCAGCVEGKRLSHLAMPEAKAGVIEIERACSPWTEQRCKECYRCFGWGVRASARHLGYCVECILGSEPDERVLVSMLRQQITEDEVYRTTFRGVKISLLSYSDLLRVVTYFRRRQYP